MRPGGGYRASCRQAVDHGLVVVAGSVAGHRNDEEREGPEDGMLDRVRVLRERAVGSAAPEDEAETLASRPGPTILDCDERHSHPAAPERADTEPRVQAPREHCHRQPVEATEQIHGKLGGRTWCRQSTPGGGPDPDQGKPGREGRQGPGLENVSSRHTHQHNLHPATTGRVCDPPQASHHAGSGKARLAIAGEGVCTKATATRSPIHRRPSCLRTLDIVECTHPYDHYARVAREPSQGDGVRRAGRRDPRHPPRKALRSNRPGRITWRHGRWWVFAPWVRRAHGPRLRRASRPALESPREVIVLDTGAWIWWVTDPSRLSRRARTVIETEEARQGLIVSAISVWEVAVKVALGKLELDRDVRSWISLASVYPGVIVHPLDARDALESTLLPGRFHRDPADRILIALARRLGVPLVTSDRVIRRYRHVRTAW